MTDESKRYNGWTTYATRYSAILKSNSTLATGRDLRTDKLKGFVQCLQQIICTNC